MISLVFVISTITLLGNLKIPQNIMCIILYVCLCIFVVFVNNRWSGFLGQKKLFLFTHMNEKFYHIKINFKTSQIDELLKKKQDKKFLCPVLENKQLSSHHNFF